MKSISEHLAGEVHCESSDVLLHHVSFVLMLHCFCFIDQIYLTFLNRLVGLFLNYAWNCECPAAAAPISSNLSGYLYFHSSTASSNSVLSRIICQH